MTKKDHFSSNDSDDSENISCMPVWPYEFETYNLYLYDYFVHNTHIAQYKIFKTII